MLPSVLSIEYPDGSGFGIDFSNELTPWLGVLLNENGWTNNETWRELSNIFMEPCTSPMDRPDKAAEFDTCLSLKQEEPIQWHLHLVAGDVQNVIDTLKGFNKGM